jgi:hypothetical protein
MITIKPAPKCLNVCQGCMSDKHRTWMLRFTSELDSHSSQSVVVVLCAHCLWETGIKTINVAKDNLGEVNARDSSDRVRGPVRIHRPKSH